MPDFATSANNDSGNFFSDLFKNFLNKMVNGLLNVNNKKNKRYSQLGIALIMIQILLSPHMQT